MRSRRAENAAREPPGLSRDYSDLTPCASEEKYRSKLHTVFVVGFSPRERVEAPGF